MSKPTEESATGKFYYSLPLLTRGATGWIDVAQWFVAAGWVLFSWWIFLGSGWRLIVRAMAVFCGVFAEEAALRVVALPEWFAVTLALLSLLVVLQVLWKRCKTSVTSTNEGWKWKGRRGPAEPFSPIWTMGGGWCREERGRWFFIPAGFTDSEGLDWWDALEKKRRRGWMSAASPAFLFLILIVSGAFVAVKPFRSFRNDWGTIRRNYGNEDAPAVRKALKRHPELKPYALYTSTLPACAQNACLKKQLAARMEMNSIGPFYGMERGILIRLLVLQGKARMAVRLSGADSSLAFEVAVRTGNPKRARKILQNNPRINLARRGGDRALLMLEEGRYDEALAVVKRDENPHVYRNLSLRVVAASLTGECAEVQKNVIYLYFPSNQMRVELHGEASATGLGLLLRASMGSLEHASRAIAMMVDGQQTGAALEWSEAEREARAAGIPGVLDRDRVLIGLLDPSLSTGRSALVKKGITKVQ